MIIFYEFMQFFLFYFLLAFAKLTGIKKIQHFLSMREPKNFYQKLQLAEKNYLQQKKERQRPLRVFWFHVASAGEMEQTIPIAKKLHESLDAYFFLTYYSSSTKPFLKNFPALLGSSELPLDVRSVYKKIFLFLPIEKLFFVRYDIWPCLILIAKEKKLQINLISATKNRTKKGVLYFLSLQWNAILYKNFSYIFTIQKKDIDYFSKFIPKRYVIQAGDPKWERAKARALNCAYENNEFPIILKEFQTIKNKTIIFGSPHAEEHDIAVKISHLKNIFLIYAPHHVDPSAIDKMTKEFKELKPILFSQILQKKYPFLNLNNLEQETRILIIDVIGYLAELYSIAGVAVIGGGFDGQIHNTLEAAAHSVPTLYGRKLFRAPEARLLAQSGAAITFAEPEDLFHFLEGWVNVGGETQKRVDSARKAAADLFLQIPNTSEVILQETERI